MSFVVDYECKASVFNIQTYCIHDGPGIRTTVFVKGCPLRCLWCANPESNAAYPELMTYSSKCTGCGKCIGACPKGAISIGERDGKYISITDREKCVNCGACTEVCPHDAREIAGKLMTVREAIDKVKRDKLFYDGSGGGMTISGGEALAHADFSANLFAAAHAEGINTAIETSSYASREAVDKVFAHVDLGLLDVKHMNSELHKKYTGVPNERILDNIRHVHVDMKVPVILRIPTIPGYNDSDENIRATGEFAASLGDDVSVNLLPYHKLGDSKSESLGHARDLGIEVPDNEHMEHLRSIIESCGVKAKIGG
jgi:pyruvate formate lyase activating enzyme